MKRVAVEVRAAQREEGLARCDRARVDRDVQSAGAAARCGRCRAPPAAAALRAHAHPAAPRFHGARTPRPLRRDRRTGVTRPARDLIRLVPLARDDDDVAGIGRADRAPRSRARRSSCTGRARSRARDDRRGDRGGSSLRGLSFVTITASAKRGRDRAHLRTLAGIAIAAASEHGDHPARRKIARGAAARAPAHRACARSRRSRRLRPSRDRLHPPRHPFESGECAA